MLKKKVGPTMVLNLELSGKMSLRIGFVQIVELVKRILKWSK